MRSTNQTIGGEVWRTKTGVEIPVTDMTDSHLENALALCIRMGRYREMVMLAEELERRSPCGRDELLDDCVVGGCDRYGSLSND